MRSQVISKALNSTTKEAPQNPDEKKASAESKTETVNLQAQPGAVIENIAKTDDPRVLQATIAEIKKQRELEVERGVASGELANRSGVNLRIRQLKRFEKTAQKRLNKINVGRLSGRTPEEVTAAENTSLARERADEARRIEAEKIAFESGRTLNEGVGATRDGRQLIVTKGKRAENAGELVRRLEGKQFTPGRLSRRSDIISVQEPGREQTLNTVTSIGLDNAAGLSRSGRSTSNDVNFSNSRNSDLSQTKKTNTLRAGALQKVKDIGGFFKTAGQQFARGDTVFEERFVKTDSGIVDTGRKSVKSPELGLVAGTVLATPATLTAGGSFGIKAVGATSLGFFGSKAVDTLARGDRFSAGGALVDTALFAAPFAQPAAQKAGSLVSRLDPRFVSSKTGELTVPTSKGSTTIRTAGSVDSIAEPVSTQAKIAGTEVDAVSGARDLFTLTKPKLVVDKPLPTPDSPPLEKSFFADPRGRIRPTRLGLAQEATTADISSGNFQLFSSKPQAIVFPKTKVESFPKELRTVEQKLLTDKTLTRIEQERLVRFQLSPSGEFKPVGFISKEPEVTLAPGEVIAKERTVGVTVINGRRVPIIEARIDSARNLPRGSTVLGGDIKAARGAGLKVDISSRNAGRPLLRPSRVSAPVTQSASVLSRSPSVPTRVSSSSVSPRPSSSSSSSSSKTSGTSLVRGASSVSSGVSRSSGSSSVRGTSGSSGSSSIVPPSFIKPPEKRTPIRKPDFERDVVKPAFSVFTKVKGEFQKIGSGLTRSEAITKGVRTTGRSALATFKITQEGTTTKKDTGLGADVRRQFSEFFRPPKRGSKGRNNDFTFVEKRRFRINTPGELREITRRSKK